MMIAVNIILILILIVCSAYFAGTETGVYRLSRLRLRIGCEKNKPAYKLLFKLLKDGEGLILSLLLGNNIVNYFATLLATMTFLTLVDNSNRAEILATCVMTPVLFIFGEIVPKNVFYYKANSILPGLSRVIYVIDRFFTLCGAKWLLRMLSRGVSTCLGLSVEAAKAVDASKRHQVRQIIHETQEEGVLSETQKEMMSRLIDIPTVSAATVMVRLADVEMIPVHISREDLVRHLGHSHFTRQLVCGDKPDDIKGYVTIYDLMASLESFTGIEEVVIPLTTIDRKASVIECINTLRNKRQRIALVTETKNNKTLPAGIITISDLVEELTGELNR